MSLTSSELRDSFKYLFPDELPALKELASWLPSRPIIINIGAGAGTSGLAFVESRPDVTLLTVDITNKSSPFGCLEAERQVFEQAGYLHLWGTRWFQYHGSSTDLLPKLRTTPSIATLSGPFELWKWADLIFIDGDHSYEGCGQDITNSMYLTRAGGIIAVHDYEKDSIPPNPNGPHPMHWPGVDKAVKELLVGNPLCEFCMHVDSLVAFRRMDNV